MKRTSIVTLAVLALIAGVISYLLELLFQTRGEHIFIAPFTVSMTLLTAGALCVIMALPVRRVVTGKRKQRLSPFYAARVLALSKAVAYVGSIGFGLALGILIYLLSRPTTPPTLMLINSISLVLAAAISVAGGLIAESMCRIPPTGTDKTEDSESATTA